jgi:hypothetical protein
LEEKFFCRLGFDNGHEISWIVTRGELKELKAVLPCSWEPWP